VSGPSPLSAKAWILCPLLISAALLLPALLPAAHQDLLEYRRAGLVSGEL